MGLSLKIGLFVLLTLFQIGSFAADKKPVKPATAKTEQSEGIDRAAVRNVFRSVLGTIKKCYEDELKKNPGMEGKLVVTVGIDEQGKVSKSMVKSSALKSPATESCILEIINKQQFPKPPDGTIAEVDYPFVFGVQE